MDLFTYLHTGVSSLPKATTRWCPKIDLFFAGVVDTVGSISAVISAEPLQTIDNVTHFVHTAFW